MNLYEFAAFAVELGMYSGINLDGGGSATMSESGVLISEPSWSCKSPSTELFAAHSYCAKEVSSVTCIHAMPPQPILIQDHASPTPSPSTSPTMMMKNSSSTAENSTEILEGVAGVLKKELDSRGLGLAVLTFVLIFSVLYNIRLLFILKVKMAKISSKSFEMSSNVSSSALSRSGTTGSLSSSAGGPSKGTGVNKSMAYSKVEIDSDDDDNYDSDGDDEVDDVDMNIKEFNPFSRLSSNGIIDSNV